MTDEHIDQILPGLLHWYTDSGSGAISATTGALDQPAAFKALTVHLGSAPSTSENLTVTIDHRLGGTFDAVVATHDLSGSTDLVIDRTDLELTLSGSSALKAAWSNTDGVVWGLEITLEEGVI